MAEIIIKATSGGTGSGIVGAGSWSDCHSNGSANSTFGDVRARDKNDSGYQIIRGWAFFNTSSIGGSTVLNNVKMRMYRSGGGARGNGSTTCYMTPFNPSTFDPNSRRSDYYNRSQYGTQFASFNYNSLNNFQFNDVTIPTSVVNKTGWTKIGWRTYYDYFNSAPPSGENDFVFGNVGSFEIVRLVITTSEVPQVTTSAVTNVGIYEATGNGNVTSDGGQTITERGIVINTTGNPTISDQKFTTGGTTGAFSVDMTNLISGKLYYARAFATNPVGTSYGGQVTFETLQGGALFMLLQ
jgi:hypothetical protein